MIYISHCCLGGSYKELPRSYCQPLGLYTFQLLSLDCRRVFLCLCNNYRCASFIVPKKKKERIRKDVCHVTLNVLYVLHTIDIHQRNGLSNVYRCIYRHTSNRQHNNKVARESRLQRQIYRSIQTAFHHQRVYQLVDDDNGSHRIYLHSFCSDAITKQVTDEKNQKNF